MRHLRWASRCSLLSLALATGGLGVASACSDEDGSSESDDVANGDEASDDSDADDRASSDGDSSDGASDDDTASSVEDTDDVASNDDSESSSDDSASADDDSQSSADDIAGDDSTDQTSRAAGSSELDACENAPGQIFPPEAPWNTPVDDAPLDAESDSIISYLQDNHDTGTRFQTDFSIRVLSADDSTPHLEFSPSDAFYGNECDPAPPPVPEGGSLEGESGYACESDGDCHLIVVDHDECRLYEMWRADIRGDSFDGGCQAIWEIDRVYGPEGRGDYCTSADAAGLPIAPLLVNADEVYAGEVRHALRFILPNQHIRDDIYVRPGTHSTGAASGPPDAPPYSARLRLKADTDVSALSPGAQAVARALMTYGMFLADGGNLTFTMQSDRDTEHSWDDAQLTPQDLKSLEWSDFEVVELGERISYSGGDCTREQVTR